MDEPINKAKRKKAVIRFSGDSGDGIQLTGNLFSETSAFTGNNIATFPDYPAEIRAPQGSIAGVSSFQVQIGETEIYTPGDIADILVVMNPAALKSNLSIKRNNERIIISGGTIIADKDNFNIKNLKNAEYDLNPLEDGSLDGYNVLSVPISSLTKACTGNLGLDMQSMMRCKNMFALGIVYWLFNKSLDNTISFIEEKFIKNQKIAEANKRALVSGYNYADSIQMMGYPLTIPPATLTKGKYRNINGNTAIAWGLLAASEKSGKKLNFCSYPITPASDIMHELALRKDFGAIIFKAEDEISAICAAIGASFAGGLAVTSTSGPGFSLKTEGIGLAVMTELPLVIINVQRAGPSTGMPTKTEQGDLMQAIYGRHGEAPVMVMAASSPANCFHFAYEACRFAIERTTPVILLSDAYIANGTHPWKIPDLNNFTPFNVSAFQQKDIPWNPYLRNTETLSRYWITPGEKNFEHRIGGLEKEGEKGLVTYDPINHEKMVLLREEKINKICNYIPDQKIHGSKSGKMLIVGWGSSHGALLTAVNQLNEENYGLGLCIFNYIKPLPKNTSEIFSKFETILVCELNRGQFFYYLRSVYPEFQYQLYSKVQGLPFFVSEIKEKILDLLNNKNDSIYRSCYQT